MYRNWSNQKSNPALKTKARNKNITNRQYTMRNANRAGSYFPKGGHSLTQTELKV